MDVLWACGGGDGGDDQKDQRTMKTLGRDIVGSLWLFSSFSLYLGRRCRSTDSFHPLPSPSASSSASYVAVEATSYISCSKT